MNIQQTGIAQPVIKYRNTCITLCSVLATIAVAHANPVKAFGFGSDQPLNVAVKAIAPPHTQVIYTPGVDKSVDVSWRGGVAWPVVMQRVISKLGLHYKYSGNLLTISKPITVPESGQTSNGLLILNNVKNPATQSKPMHYEPLSFSVVQQNFASKSNDSVPGSPKDLQDYIFKPHQTTANLNKDSMLQAGVGTIASSAPIIEGGAVSNAKSAQKSGIAVSILRPPFGAQAATMAAASQIPIIQSPAQIKQTWLLAQDVPIKAGIEQWAHKAGWSLIWRSHDWLVAANTSFYGSFPQAVRGAVNDMRAQGVDVHAKFYRGNRTLEIGSSAAIIQAEKP